ncbi:uncharacterized protein LOC135843327 [Planococcus citri]|uniref:uncharacterized protein LOC135843327 n=1 Tax=Planococcus citri TaxID=170843 RepID=UPI0031F7E456
MTKCLSLLLVITVSPVIALWDDATKDHEIFNTSSGVFVDKTLLIEAFFRHSQMCKYQVITSPLGFGKTTNLKMLKRFVELEVDEFGRVKNKTRTSSYKLFSDRRLKISKHAKIIENYLAEYPAIYFSFDDIIKSEDFVVNEMNLLKKFKKLYLRYKWLFEHFLTNSTSNETTREDGIEMKLSERKNFIRDLIDENDPTSSQVPSMDTLSILAEILYSYFGRKVFIFIDNYDSVWVDGLRDNVDKLWYVDVGRHLHEIIRVLFGPEMKKYIEYIFITGTNTIFLHAMSNNISYNRFLDDNHPFTRYYGFSENEVLELLEQHDIDTKNISDLKILHNGYSTRTSEMQLFQSSSIVDYVTKSTSNKSSSYKNKKYLWLDSGSLIGQWKALFDGTVYERVKRLMDVKSTTFELYRFCDEKGTGELQNLSNVLKVQQPLLNVTVDWFFSLLFENGYFTYSDKAGGFKIPNRSRENAFIEVLAKVDKILESVMKAERYFNYTTESSMQVFDF